MPTLVAEDVVSVQPLKQKAGIVFYMKNVYDDNKGTIAKGDAISTIERVWPEASKLGGAIEYSSEWVDAFIIWVALKWKNLLK